MRSRLSRRDDPEEPFEQQKRNNQGREQEKHVGKEPIETRSIDRRENNRSNRRGNVRESNINQDNWSTTPAAGMTGGVPTRSGAKGRGPGRSP
jgi:hypothetical protein